MERSEKILQGLGNQYYRATLKSMGFTTEDLKRPVIGIANAWSECVPGHYNLRQVAQRVKDGIYRAGGTPIEFGVIGGCDGMGQGHDGMHYILPSRELIANSIESMAQINLFDGLVLLGSCDKIVPGMLMAAARLNIPCIFLPGGPMEGGVVFDGVDFGYDENKLVLHDISLWAKPGQKIAFVGATGAGKTTITNLINRFYDIADGKIRYDGININKIKKPDLRSSLGIVLQDTHLFTGTVLENIRYGNLDATDEECKTAAKLANADGFIRRLPDGYDTMLTGDGANLSQGQRQLIAIARAAVADPPVLILDEATSSIDTRTEKLVQDGMDALMCGRTTFVIAHRLSTVRNADCIMVMDQGRIIERGTHDELIEKKGTYYRLYTGNFAEEPA